MQRIKKILWARPAFIALDWQYYTAHGQKSLYEIEQATIWKPLLH